MPPSLSQFLLAMSIAAGPVPASAQQQAPPNIVLVVADDLGWTDLSSGATNMGNRSHYYRTPNIDALAARGMAFDNAYANGPNCSPSRAALMTGSHAARTGVYTVNSNVQGNPANRKLSSGFNEPTLRGPFVTMAEVLRAAGYATGNFGKWHLGGSAAGEGPVAQGFQHNAAGTARGGPTGGSNGHFAQVNGAWNLPNMPPNGVPFQFMADRVTDEALAWIGANAGAPFFALVSHFSVHQPTQAPAAAIAAFNEVAPTAHHNNHVYAGQLKNLDDNFGRLIAFLETTQDPSRPQQKLIDNTLVIFTSDNGGLGGYASAGVVGSTEVTSQAPLKSGKSSLYEGGIRVPLIVRWDRRVAADTVCSTPVQLFDLFPTLAGYAGASIPAASIVDGVDIAPLLAGSEIPPRPLFWHFPAYVVASASLGTWRSTPSSAIRVGRWKLLFFYETRSWELYDLQTDIGELHNLAFALPARVTAMGSQLSRWLSTTGASLPRYKDASDRNPQPQVPLPMPDA